jgi:hypothetical protein
MKARRAAGRPSRVDREGAPSRPEGRQAGDVLRSIRPRGRRTGAPAAVDRRARVPGRAHARSPARRDRAPHHATGDAAGPSVPGGRGRPGPRRRHRQLARRDGGAGGPVSLRVARLALAELRPAPGDLGGHGRHQRRLGAHPRRGRPAEPRGRRAPARCGVRRRRPARLRAGAQRAVARRRPQHLQLAREDADGAGRRQPPAGPVQQLPARPSAISRAAWRPTAATASTWTSRWPGSSDGGPRGR